MEYEVVHLDCEKQGASAHLQKKFLNDWVDKGWELVTVVADVSGYTFSEGRETSLHSDVNGFWFYFKRKVGDN